MGLNKQSFQSYWALPIYRKLLTFWNSDFILSIYLSQHCPCYIFYHTKMSMNSLQIYHNVKYRCTGICSSCVHELNHHILTGGLCKIKLIWTSFMIFQFASKQITWYISISQIERCWVKYILKCCHICNMIKQGNISTTQKRKKCREVFITHHLMF